LEREGAVRRSEQNPCLVETANSMMSEIRIFDNYASKKAKNLKVRLDLSAESL